VDAEPPLLVVEIRSPSTTLVDLNRKKAAYERFGVPFYWLFEVSWDAVTVRLRRVIRCRH
jgi:Uma2 family endonuclease